MKFYVILNQEKYIEHVDKRFKSNYINSIKCNAFLDNIIPKELLLELYSTLVKFQNVTEDLSGLQKWEFLAFAGLSWIYLTAKPGLLVGAIDAYLMAPIQMRSLKRSDLVIGDKLGEGSFGVLVPRNVNNVEQERIKKSGNKGRNVITKLDAKSKDKVILKKVKVGIEGAEEFGECEEWFNYRLSRAAPEMCARFLGSFVADKSNSLFTKGGKWLVWKFEALLFMVMMSQGGHSFADYMTERNFPSNLESVMFRRVLQGINSSKRDALIIKQMITSLKKIHDTCIVHRDIKPANLVVTKQGQIKLIDFGSATDLRIGKNYVPNFTPLDPDYCPPELYVLAEEITSLPPEPVAAFRSPILWQLKSPDLFDMYSAGIILLQMAIPTLRSKSTLKNFNLELRNCGFYLKKWRDFTRNWFDFRILDGDSGRG
ncbi:hypothetical protein Ahy_B04g071534 [Arachis hypogaea]|uniref:Protein kinase domain-containing protein n=1 Tax=Arachis hypogaea TaxID=3818 RepID=A0A444ZKX4_ARAHY|nr:hypothetical protein Ahy_B04g071534 [Arachis hypogaea]